MSWSWIQLNIPLRSLPWERAGLKYCLIFDFVTNCPKLKRSHEPKNVIKPSLDHLPGPMQGLSAVSSSSCTWTISCSSLGFLSNSSMPLALSAICLVAWKGLYWHVSRFTYSHSHNSLSHTDCLLSLNRTILILHNELSPQFPRKVLKNAKTVFAEL